MNSQLDFIVRLISKEIWGRRKLVMFLYVLSSMGFLVAAWVWPRVYTATSVISVDQVSILSPLMQGTAVTTEVSDRSKIAKQIIFSRASMERILGSSVWNPSQQHPAIIEDNVGSSEPVVPLESITQVVKAVVPAEEKVLSSTEITNNTGASGDDQASDNSAVLENSFSSNYTAKEFDTFSMQIRNNTMIENVGGNLIKISYKDLEPKKAYGTAKLLAKNFIEESLRSKQSESRSAFDFIDNQVSIYQAKLQNVETAIKDFRSRNIESTPGAKENANAKLIELKGELESTELEISAERSSISAMNKQLKGEVNVDKESLDRETQFNARILVLENRLSELRLNYLESYPDVVQVKSQIASLRRQIQSEKASRIALNNLGVSRLPSGAVADDLRRKILIARTNITTLNSRAEQFQMRIEREKQTLSNINAVEAEISELTRDYTVNQNMYQNLLEKRENARISMNMDIEDQGLTIKVQESAVLPVTPKGIRFAHIILAGLIISFVIPIGIVYAMTLVDEKVRNRAFFRETFQVPILGSVYQFLTPVQRKSSMMKLFIMLSVVLMVWSIYGYTIWLRIQE